MTARIGRRFVSAMQITLDGYIEGADGEKDWADSWATALELVPDVDLFILGAGMYPGYGQFWQAIYDNPTQVPPFEQRLPLASEVAYADLAKRTRHVVLSQTLTAVDWPAAEIVHDIAALRRIKAEPGGTSYVVGGAGLVSGMIEADLIDELIVIVHPLLLGSGKPLFAPLSNRRSFRPLSAGLTADNRCVLRFERIATPD